MSQENKAVARRCFEEIISQGNLDAVADVFAADYQDHDPANDEQVQGADGAREEISGYRTGYPDLTFTVHDQLAEGDLVASRWTVNATHQGELFGIPPTGNQVEVTGITIHRIADGKIAEGWWNWDQLGMMRQLGVIPAEQPA